MKIDLEESLKDFATMFTVNCVRNSWLEDLHSGVTPSSKTGDYSDVKVVSPYGEIPWSEVSRISDEEMKRLMKDINHRMYRFLCDTFGSIGKPRDEARETRIRSYELAAATANEEWDDPSIKLMKED